MAANLHRKVRGLEAAVSCPAHPDEPLICGHCDLPDEALSPQEWVELTLLLEKSGYLREPPIEYPVTCWRCGWEGMSCQACLEEQGEPSTVDWMDAGALDRMYTLAAKLIPAR